MYLILTFIFAALSLLYEFALSQLLTSLTGSTFKNYSLIIGLFTACLGLGSFYYDKYIIKKNIALLLYTEVALSLTAFLAPVYILILYSWLSFLPPILLLILSMIPIIIVGVLSGIELPALLNISNLSSSKILFADFLGMFISSIIFYNYILLRFSVFQIIFSLALLNSICCILILKTENYKNTRFISFLSIALILNLTGLLFHKNYLQMAQRMFLN